MFATFWKIRVFTRQVVLPVLEEYIRTHRLHFLTCTSSGILSHASKKEKEMIARYLQGMANQLNPLDQTRFFL